MEMHKRTPLSSLWGSLDSYAIHSTVCLQDSLDWGYTWSRHTHSIAPHYMTLSAGTIAAGTSGATLGRKYCICVTCVCVGIGQVQFSFQTTLQLGLYCTFVTTKLTRQLLLNPFQLFSIEKPIDMRLMCIKGVGHPKKNILWKCTHSQTI